MIVLTPEEIARYHADGFLLLGKILSDELIEELRREELRFRTSPVWPQEDFTGQTLFRAQVQAYSAAVRRAGLEGAHVGAMRQLIGSNVIFWYTQFVTKFPDGNTGKSVFPWHQDNGYAKGILPDTNITVWVALEDVNERNGCVYVAPGSHKQGLLPHETSGVSWHLEVPVKGNGVPAILKAGEAVAFTGLTLHRSLLNHTDQPRRGFFMEYADADACDQATTEKPQRLVERPGVFFLSGQADLSKRKSPP